MIQATKITKSPNHDNIDDNVRRGPEHFNLSQQSQ